MTTLAGLAAIGVGMAFDAAENEDLHVTVDADEDEFRPDGADRPDDGEGQR
ncbi:hypothetical protein [Halorussus caseinilyticus]|uniref:Uncharacterized protein n=1 Tax=Halorussus caseinilyticus TaxID=3034025 RepID=A0ABD5WLH9_9EURY|nr:hypothetical protein [Halorussus sp. DT72]